MSRVVFFLIGLLLSVTAILKLWMLMTDPFADITAQMPRELIWAALFTELATIVVLISRSDISTKWTWSVLVFGSFLIFSLARLWMGYTSCGCTGRIQLAPWVSIVVNSASIALLFFCRPAAQMIAERIRRQLSEIHNPQNLGRVAAVVVGSSLFCFFQSQAGSKLLGSNNSVTGNVAGLPATLIAGQLFELTATLHNSTNQPIPILGFSKSCTCIADTENAPRLIAPQSEVRLRLTVTPHNVGRFNQRVVCYLDAPGQSAVSLDLNSFVR